MARYLLTCEHVPEDCLGDLDSIFSFSHELLGRFDWGCKDGEHVGWVVVEAQDEATARMLLPTSIRRKARVRKVNKFSQEDLQAAHEAIAAMQRPSG
jgi:hypothetical protein